MDDATTPEIDELAKYEWLCSSAAVAAIEAASTHSGPLHSLIQTLRSAPHLLSAEQSGLVTGLLDLRRRATAKFRHASRMWFATQLLEQATDEQIAAYKASRFPPGAQVTDFCCGLGGDLIALAQRGPVAAVDKSPVAIQLARANLQAQPEHPQHRNEATFHTTSAEAFLANNELGHWSHVDPDRRGDGIRTSAWELCQPGPATLEAMRARARGLSMKLAPAAEVPASWEDSEREWIGTRGECRQQVVWTGELARPHRRSATVIDAAGLRHTYSSSDLDADVPWAGRAGRYLFEPHSAFLAAKLAAALGSEHDLEAAEPHGGYLMSDASLEHLIAFGAVFEVLEAMPFDVKRVRQHLRQRRCNRLEVKRRGHQESPEQILKRLKWKPSRANSNRDQVTTLIVAPLNSGVAALICQRVTRDTAVE